VPEQVRRLKRRHAAAVGRLEASIRELREKYQARCSLHEEAREAATICREQVRLLKASIDKVASDWAEADGRAKIAEGKVAILEREADELHRRFVSEVSGLRQQVRDAQTFSEATAATWREVVILLTKGAEK
jgi:peptidoglycan hydrolase CwlO-like protein